tara:strand:+ start:434 stop:1327 length:894 start_codon:yes stop_codon:yes gene_type:complete
MRIFENKEQSPYGRRAPACSYCRVRGHNVNECPNVKDDFQLWENYKVPINSPTAKTCTWFKNPKYWGEWYTKCSEAYHKQEAFKARQEKKKTSGKKSVVRHCGFCGETDHTRRNCKTKDSFLQECYEANENWRRAAYQHLVKDLGLSVGAIIKVKECTYYGQSEAKERIATISSINWDSLNICTGREWGWDNGWIAQGLQIQAILDGKKINIQEQSKDGHSGQGNITQDKSVIANLVRGYSSFKFVGLLSRSPHELSEEWVTSYKQAFDYLVKKKSLEKLQEVGFTQLVDKWKNAAI